MRFTDAQALIISAVQDQRKFNFRIHYTIVGEDFFKESYKESGPEAFNKIEENLRRGNQALIMIS
jgi:hypothetical protein